jgi:hypothetical protein
MPSIAGMVTVNRRRKNENFNRQGGLSCESVWQVWSSGADSGQRHEKKFHNNASPSSVVLEIFLFVGNFFFFALWW